MESLHYIVTNNARSAWDAEINPIAEPVRAYGDFAQCQTLRACMLDLNRDVQLISGCSENWDFACRILDNITAHAQRINPGIGLRLHILWDTEHEHFHVIVRDDTGRVY